MLRLDDAILASSAAFTRWGRMPNGQRRKDACLPLSMPALGRCHIGIVRSIYQVRQDAERAATQGCLLAAVDACAWTMPYWHRPQHLPLMRESVVGWDTAHESAPVREARSTKHRREVSSRTPPLSGCVPPCAPGAVSRPGAARSPCLLRSIPNWCAASHSA